MSLIKIIRRSNVKTVGKLTGICLFALALVGSEVPQGPVTGPFVFNH